MSDTDQTARVAELALLVATRLAEDEAVAQKAIAEYPGPWSPVLVMASDNAYVVDRDGLPVCTNAVYSTAEHVARNDPARALRRVKATRDLVAAILAEPHDYIPGDEFYSCSQAVDPYPGESGEPGSGCSDPERAGKPCDCGRDARVARLLGIIATEWEDVPS